VLRVIALVAGLAMFAAADAAPTCEVLPGWSQDGAGRTFEGENLFEYMNGNSEGYLLYGFLRMRGITCAKGGAKVLIDISEMPDEESAFGLFSSHRDVKVAGESIGASGQVVPRKAIFVKGKYFAELAAEAEGDHSAMLRAAAKALEARIPGSTTVPAPVGWFPSEGLTAGPPRLFPESPLGVRLLKRGYVAQYGAAKAFVVTESSPEGVREILKKWLGRFETVGEAKVAGADEAYQMTDKYLGRIAVARVGSRLAGYAGVPDGTDAVALASALVARLPK
jgi:hypothetical protein